MELKTFVTNTLTQIIEGVKEAIAIVGEDDGSGCINPEGTKDLSNRVISFDVGVTVEEIQGSTKDGTREIGGKIQIAQIFSIGHKRNTSTTEETHDKNQSVCRIQFEVPIRLPATLDAKKSRLEAESEKKKNEAAARFKNYNHVAR